jgi:hypothetical protein
MARPLRVEFDGALYHVTSRGNSREDIFDEDGDRCKGRIFTFGSGSHGTVSITQYPAVLISSPGRYSITSLGTRDPRALKSPQPKLHFGSAV